MEEDVRAALAKRTADRLSTEAALSAIEDDIEALIVRAWRERVPPTEIAKLVQRSTTHVRNLRPADVPPARLGGNASPKGRKRK